MNESAKRIYGKTLAFALALSMLLTGPLGLLEAHAEDGTGNALESIGGSKQVGSGGSETSGDGQSPATPTPSDLPPTPSPEQDGGEQSQQVGSGGSETSGEGQSPATPTPSDLPPTPSPEQDGGEQSQQVGSGGSETLGDGQSPATPTPSDLPPTPSPEQDGGEQSQQVGSGGSETPGDGQSPATPTPSDLPPTPSPEQDGGEQSQQVGSGGSDTSGDGQSPATPTPSDAPPTPSPEQDEGESSRQRSAAPANILAASVAAVVTATVGYQDVHVNLSGSEIFASETILQSLNMWLIEDINLQEVEISSVSRVSDKSVKLTLKNPLQPGTYKLFTDTAVFIPEAGDIQEYDVTVYTPVPAVGAATATAGGKTIDVALIQGAFSNSSNKGNWMLGGTSASGNPIASVAYQNGRNVTITLTNTIAASDNYTLQAQQGAFINILTQPFVSPLIVTIDPGDTTPPAFVVGYPQVGGMSSAGRRQVNFAINAQEAAFYDYVLLPDNAVAPSAEQVRDGQAADSQPALKAYSGQNKLTANSALSTGTFTPDHNTDYDLYVILRDDAGNLSVPVKLDVKSPPAAAFFADGYPSIGDVQPNGSKQVQIRLQVQDTDSGGKVYWVLLPDGATEPTIDELGKGEAGGGGAPASSGSTEFENDTLSSFLVTGAEDATAYDLYMVVGDIINYSPLSECSAVFKLDVTTPAAGSYAFEVVGGAQHATLSGALGVVGNNGTIKLLRTANTTDNITLLNKTITLDLNGFDLNISSSANEGIKVTEGTLAVTGFGKLNATGKLYGVWANKGSVTVDTASSGSDGIGVYAMGGSKVTVRANASGQSIGVYATDSDTLVTVNGNVSSTEGQIHGAVYSLNQAVVNVGGEVNSVSGNGVHTSNSGVITVNGDVYGLRAGALTEGSGGSITVKGELSSHNHCAVITKGSSGNITVDGTVTPKNTANYVLINNVAIQKTAGVSDPGKPGYLKYSGDGATGIVWVKQAVCEIAGGPQYTSLADALSDVTNGQTIRLLQDITHPSPVKVIGMSITFDLNGFDLTIDSSATEGSTALLVESSANVGYTGTGKFSVIGKSTAVHADGTGSAITVDYAETTGDSAYTVQATGGSVTVKGAVLAKGAGSNALWAAGGGSITVEGSVTCSGENSRGVLSSGTNSSVTVNSSVTAIAAGIGSTGVSVSNGGEAIINGNIAASKQGITTSGMGGAGTVTVTGNVSTTGTATGSADREGISAGGDGTVLVNGSVSAAGENCAGIYANGSTVTVTGDVTSANTGVVSTGNASLTGSVIIGGELKAGTTYIRVGSTPKTAAEDSKPSDRQGYLKYTDGTHNVYIKDPSTVITVANANELEAALTNVVNGGTIRLTADIIYRKKIVVDTKSFTLDVGTFTLNLEVYATTTVNALELKNGGDLALAGTGQFNVNLTGVNASAAVYANEGSKVTVTSVKVNVGSGSAFGVYANGTGSEINVLGDVDVTGTTGGCGAKTWGTGNIRIDGIMTAPIYINLNSVYKAKSSGVVDGAYLKYSAVSNGPGIVWVKIAPVVCEIIGGAQYDNLPEALSEAASGMTIRLLADIAYNKSVDTYGAIQISGKTLTIDLNGRNLTVQNPDGSGLQLDMKANVTVSGTGNLKIVSKFAALNVNNSIFNSGENVNVDLESSLNTGICAYYGSSVDIKKGSIIGVTGGIYTSGSNNTVTFGGSITVNGQPYGDAHGINLSGSYTGNTVHVSGDINIASGLGTGIYVENGGVVTVGSQQNPVSVTSSGSGGIWTRQGSTTADITVYGTVTGKGRAIDANGDADIKVYGNVKSNSTTASVFAVEGMANSGDVITVNITGNVEGPSGVKYHGNNGKISVTGNVTATGSASDTVGVYASYGSVSVSGNVSAPNGIGAEAGENGEITIDGVLTGKTYIRVYIVSKTADEKTLPTTKAGYHTYKNNSAVVWIKEGAPATAYLLTVENGTGGGSYLPGTPVSITANPPADGKVFDKWTTSGGGSFGNANSAVTTFTMPSNAVTVTATYKDAPVDTYLLTVVSGTGGGSYSAGTEVSVTANPPAQGKVFDKWISSGGGSFGDANSAVTTFTMPSNAVTVTATYKDAPVDTYLLTVVSGSGGGSYSASTEVPVTANPPAQGKVFDKWISSGGGSFGDANSAVTTFTMPSNAVTVTATYKDAAPAESYILTVEGSNAESSGAGQYAPGTEVSIRAGSRSNYSFTGWTTLGGGSFADAGSASTTFTMPGANVTVTANWSYDGGGGGGGGGGGTAPSTPTTEWLEQKGASESAADAKENNRGNALTRASSRFGVQRAAWSALAGYEYWHDTMDGSSVQVRVYVRDPASVTTDLLVSGYVKGPEVDSIKSLFERYFRNKIRVIHLDQSEDWGQPVEIAAKVDLTGMDVTKLVFYSYDKESNTYRRIENPEYWVDTNGYLHFTTQFAGDIIISEGPLALI